MDFHILPIFPLPGTKVRTKSVLTAVKMFSKEWQSRYFLKQYVMIDPTIAQGRTAILPSWETLEKEDPAVIDFFNDAIRHKVGRNEISIPVRNRRNANAMVSFTSDAPRLAWETFKKQNMIRLQLVAALINSATVVESKFPAPQVTLSRREEHVSFGLRAARPIRKSATS